MIEDFVAVLDRSWSALWAQEGPEFVPHLMRFQSILRADHRTAAILQDLNEEEEESKRQVAKADDEAKAALRILIDDIERDHPEIVPISSPNVHTENRDRLNGNILTVEPIRSVINSVRALADRYFENVCSRVQETIAKGNETSPEIRREVEAAHALRNKINLIDAAFSHARRARRLDEVASAGAALMKLDRELEELHPPATELPAPRAQDGSLNHIRNYLFERQPALMDKKGAVEQCAPLRSLISVVFEEVRRRLGLQRSLRRIFYRYRQRCEWFEAARLRALAAADGPGKPEDRLTATLAIYLFDLGFNPLTRPMLGSQQPDLHESGPFSFYVEAKQYKDNSRRSYLLDGINQVWDMLNQIRGGAFDVKEAFFVVYRRSGPIYQFPDQVKHEGRVVFPLLVNIAETSESGVNAPKPIMIETAELLPQRSGD